MNQNLKKLLELQEIDAVIARLNSLLEDLPLQIEEKKARIKQVQETLEQAKKVLTEAHLARKSREIELSSQEEKIRKHELELSAIKSNDAYKALLSELESARNMKSGIEDEILNLMDESDRKAAQLKTFDAELKNAQKKLELEIKECEKEIGNLKDLLETETKKRENFIPQVPPDLLTRYDYIRKKKKSLAIVFIKGESCTGCNTNLTQSTLMEVKKGKDLVLCDSCSRILYIPDYHASPTQTVSP
jgi:predicted  nucleic acid-binding Zn-ribbon protein